MHHCYGNRGLLKQQNNFDWYGMSLCPALCSSEFHFRMDERSGTGMRCSDPERPTAELNPILGGEPARVGERPLCRKTGETRSTISSSFLDSCSSSSGSRSCLYVTFFSESSRVWCMSWISSLARTLCEMYCWRLRISNAN